MFNHDVKIFSCNSNKPLATEVAQILGVPLGDSSIERFSDGEIHVSIRETVRESDVFVVQSTSTPVNENLMELLIMIDAFKRASAGRITAVIPYYGYARQDRKSKARDPISAKLVANLITAAGANRVLAMDLHAPQIQGFFDIPVDHLIGVPLLYEYFHENFDKQDNMVVVSPDVGSADRTRKFAEKIHLPIAIVDKRRPEANKSEVMNIIGDIKGKQAIIVDDMIDTAGTICHAAQALIDNGATKVYGLATHGVLSGKAIERIKNSAFEEVVLLDTINLPEEKRIDKIRIIPCAKVFAAAINRIHTGVSISTMFN